MTKSFQHHTDATGCNKDMLALAKNVFLKKAILVIAKRKVYIWNVENGFCLSD